MKLFFLLPCISITLCSLYGEVDFRSKNIEENRSKESKRFFELDGKNVKYYKLDSHQSHRDITEDLLFSSDVSENHKSMIIQQRRRIVVFKYTSDGHEVKGYVSYTPKYKESALLVFLRGGNRIFGLMNPANDFSLIKNYTVVATTYRGGINEGQDEFGGEDVNDIENLVTFIPQLEAMLRLEFMPRKKFILGSSRGGMEMFLALERSPFLQTYFDKAISLSGPMDLHIIIQSRQDIKNMFERDFGLVLEKNADDWLNHRSPIKHCSSLRKDLPLLVIQGTEDHRTHLDHGKNMFAKLTRLEKKVTYWEIDGATHCLGNQPNRIELIVDWLEK